MCNTRLFTELSYCTIYPKDLITRSLYHFDTFCWLIYPHSLPLATTNLFSVYLNLTFFSFFFWIPHINEIILCLSFSVWLILLSIMPARTIHGVTKVKILLLWLHDSLFCCCCCQVTWVVSDSVRPHRRQPTRLHRPWDSSGKNTGVSCHFLLQCMKVKSESEVSQSCPTLSDPMDCSPPGSSVHGIFQARVLEWGAIAFSESILDRQKNQSINQLIDWSTDLGYC